MDLYPDFYKADPAFVAVQQALEPELQALSDHLEDCARQLVISTATWSLPLWERAYGIPTEPDKPLEERRSKVRAKLQGAGTTTVDTVKQLAAAFSGGEVEVRELPGFVVEVAFTGTLGAPPNVDDLTSAILEVLPAHLSLRYRYRYTTWADLQGKKWSQVKGKTWAQIKSEELMQRGAYHTKL